MKAILSFVISIFAFCSIPYLAVAQTCSSSICYVTPTGGSTTRNGATWNTALSKSDIISGSYNNVPTSKLTRGVTYYLAGGGSYGSIAFDDPESGTTPIRILKGTASNSGSVAGWQSAFESPAIFSTVIFMTDYIEFNGVVRNESKWNESASYGFRVMDGYFAHRDNFPPGGDNITIKYSSVGLDSATESTPGKSYGVQAWYGRHHWNITHNYFHHGLIPVHMVSNSDSILVDRNYMGPSWGKETIMALYGGSNWTVSNNILEDTCLQIAEDACSAEISGWDNGSAVFNNWNIYGNVIFRRNERAANHTGAIIWGGEAGIAHNWRVYNNVIAGISRPVPGGLQRAGIKVNGSTDSNIKIYNNIWYDIGNMGTGSSSTEGVSLTCDAGTAADSACSNNWCMAGPGASCSNIGASSTVGTTSPFVNYAAFDFRLSAGSTARNIGKNLTGVAGFEGGAIDGLGNARGQEGAWDIGAYEYVPSGGSTTPSAPTGLRVGN